MPQNDMDRLAAAAQAGDLGALVAQQMQERKKFLYHHKLPKKRTLAAMLAARTRDELEDIRYNVMLDGTSGMKKAQFIEALAPRIIQFAKDWFPSALDEQYGCFQHIAERDGITLELRDDEPRLDYLHAIGLLGCGMKGDKLAWYMPDEILTVWRGIDHDGYRAMVRTNTDAARLATGFLYYYGFLDYEQLYDKVMGMLETEEREGFSLRDFVRVLLNASSWDNTVVAVRHGAKYYTVENEDRVEDAQRAHSELDFYPLGYDAVYDAGDRDFFLASDTFKDVAQFLVVECGKTTLEASFTISGVGNLFQNGDDMPTITDYLTRLGLMTEKNKDVLTRLVAAFHASMHLWTLKGNTVEALVGKGAPVPEAQGTTKKQN